MYDSDIFYQNLEQGVPISFRWDVLVKILNLREIRILKFLSKTRYVMKLKWKYFW